MRKYSLENNTSDPLAYGFDQEEKIIWRVTPSQYTNFGFYPWFVVLFLGLLWGAFLRARLSMVFLPVPILLWLWLYLDTKATHYILTNQHFLKRSGVLKGVFNDVELIEVINVRLKAPFFRRIFSLGEIRVDLIFEYFIISAIPNISFNRDQLEHYILNRKVESGK